MRMFKFSIITNSSFRIRDKLFRVLIFIISFSLFSLALFAPTIQHFKGYPNGEYLYNSFSNICHQFPLRSFWIFDRPFALCARCTSGYFGVAIASVFLSINKKYFYRFLIGVSILILILIDPILQLLNYYESNNFIRAVTGFLGGICIFLIINPFNQLTIIQKEDVI